MNIKLTFILLVVSVSSAFADLKYNPISFKLRTDKESYYEGEKITFLIEITNENKENSYPVLVPHTQNTGQKLFYLNLYDKAENTSILRATEDKELKMMVHDTGSVKIKYLKPLEKIVIPIYLNDFENYYNYHTQNSSHHSFGVPVFAGHYKIDVCFNPNGIPLADSIYSFYDLFGHEADPSSEGIPMPEEGLHTNKIELKIKRSAAKEVSIERKKFYISDKEREGTYWYYRDSIGKGGSNPRLAHITNIPPDSAELAKGEYFYSYFPGQYAEYVVRYDDGDIKEYRKFRNSCPTYLYTEKYNANKQKIEYAVQLPDKRFYKIVYNQPGNRVNYESYCSEDGTVCVMTIYKYNKKGELTGKKTMQHEPCLMKEIETTQNGF